MREKPKQNKSVKGILEDNKCYGEKIFTFLYVENCIFKKPIEIFASLVTECTFLLDSLRQQCDETMKRTINVKVYLAAKHLLRPMLCILQKQCPLNSFSTF